jgi:hypothetical protein
VVIALGTIESTRLVLLALDGEPVPKVAGQNLLAHLRSNLGIRIPLTALAGLDPTVFLNGDRVCVFDNPYPNRGLPSTSVAPNHIGLQAHTGRVAFRNIRYKAQ